MSAEAQDLYNERLGKPCKRMQEAVDRTDGYKFRRGTVPTKEDAAGMMAAVETGVCPWCKRKVR